MVDRNTVFPTTRGSRPCVPHSPCAAELLGYSRHLRARRPNRISMSTEPSAQHAEMTPAKRTTDQIPTNAREQIGERLFNFAITHIPSHTIRQSWLRFFGMKIGKNTSIMMGTRVHGIQQLTVGNNCSIGFRCLLDARGELTIDDDVVLASDVHIVAGHHLVNSGGSCRRFTSSTTCGLPVAQPSWQASNSAWEQLSARARWSGRTLPTWRLSRAFPPSMSEYGGHLSTTTRSFVH